MTKLCQQLEYNYNTIMYVVGFQLLAYIILIQNIVFLM